MCRIHDNSETPLEVLEYPVTVIPVSAIVSQSAEPTIPVAPVTNTCLNRNKGFVTIDDVLA